MSNDIYDAMLRKGVCPKCKEPIGLKSNMFYSPRVGYMAGYLCEPCNALWDDPDNSFIEACRDWELKRRKANQ